MKGLTSIIWKTALKTNGLFYILILFVLFPQQVFGSPGGFVKNVLSRAVGMTRKVPIEYKITDRLVEIERRLGFSDLELERAAPLTMDDVRSLGIEFDPLKDQAVRRAFRNESREAFELVLFQYIADNYLHSPIILRWWDASKAFRDVVFYRLDSDYLVRTHWYQWGMERDPRLLLKWWKEAKLRDQGHRLEEFMREAFKRNPIITRRGVLEIPQYNDPFLDTIFSAVREDSEFASEVEYIIKNSSIKSPESKGIKNQSFTGGRRPHPRGSEEGILPTDDERWGSVREWAEFADQD